MLAILNTTSGISAAMAKRPLLMAEQPTPVKICLTVVAFMFSIYPAMHRESSGFGSRTVRQGASRSIVRQRVKPEADSMHAYAVIFQGGNVRIWPLSVVVLE